MKPLQILIYEPIEDYIEKRKPYRSLHFDYIQEYIDDGLVLLGGGAGDPVDKVYLVFNTHDRNVPIQFAESDPYVLNGIVKSWEVKIWHEVLRDKT